MNVRSGSFTAHGSPERIVGDSGTLEIAAQPGAFRLVGIQGYVYSSAMIETERAMQRRIALGADRKHFTELSLEGVGDPHEVGFPEQAGAVETLNGAAELECRTSFLKIAFRARLLRQAPRPDWPGISPDPKPYGETPDLRASP